MNSLYIIILVLTLLILSVGSGACVLLNKSTEVTTINKDHTTKIEAAKVKLASLKTKIVEAEKFKPSAEVGKTLKRLETIEKQQQGNLDHINSLVASTTKNKNTDDDQKTTIESHKNKIKELDQVTKKEDERLNAITSGKGNGIIKSMKLFLTKEERAKFKVTRD